MSSSDDATATGSLITPQRNEMTQERLASILESHRTWLDTGGKDGIRADLSGHDLRHLDFENADSRMAIFRSRFGGADASRFGSHGRGPQSRGASVNQQPEGGCSRKYRSNGHQSSKCASVRRRPIWFEIARGRFDQGPGPGSVPTQWDGLVKCPTPCRRGQICWP